MNKNEAMEMMMNNGMGIEDVISMLSAVLPSGEELSKKRAQCYAEMRGIETYNSKNRAAKALVGTSWGDVAHEFSAKTCATYNDFISTMSEMFDCVNGGQVGTMFFVPADESRGEYLRITVERTHGVEIARGDSICQNIKDAQKLRKLYEAADSLRKTEKKLTSIQNTLETLGNLSELFGE